MPPAPSRALALRLALVLPLALTPAGALAAEPDPAPDPDRPSEDEMFGDAAAADDDAKSDDAEDDDARDPNRDPYRPDPYRPDPYRPDEDAMFGGDDDDDAGSSGDDGGGGDFGESDAGGFSLGGDLIPNDPLTIGGLMYMRLAATFLEGVDAGEQTFSMPNLIDLYLDARPDPRVRGYIRARMRFDPTVALADDPNAAATNPLSALTGSPPEGLSIDLDQLWLKTDIARVVYITIGQQPVKWGATRVWNPVDQINRQKRDSLDFFDDRPGVTALKLHFPFEDLGWNLYALALIDSVQKWENISAAARLEMVFDSVEIGLSAIAGNQRKTAFGLDFSGGIWDFDVVAEVSVRDERGSPFWRRPLDVEEFVGSLTIDELAQLTDPNGDPQQAFLDIATAKGIRGTRDSWYPQVSAGLTYTFKYTDEDTMTLGAEYFFNPLGYDDESFYPALFVDGQFDPLYTGRHYAGVLLLVPGPGDWDEATFTTTTIGNLSDLSFITRLDFSLQVHTRLSLQAWVMGHYGTRGGELRLSLDTAPFAAFLPPDLKADLDAAFPNGEVPPPMIEAGINLRIDI